MEECDQSAWENSTCVTVSAMGHKEGEPSLASMCGYVSLRKLN